MIKRALLDLCSEPSWLGNMPVVRIPKWGNKGSEIIGWELFVQDCGNLTLACGTNGLSSLDPHSSINSPIPCPFVFSPTRALTTIKTNVTTSFINQLLPKFPVCYNSSLSCHNSKRMTLLIQCYIHFHNEDVSRGKTLLKGGERVACRPVWMVTSWLSPRPDMVLAPKLIK